jgi:hypothetical protein
LGHTIFTAVDHIEPGAIFESFEGIHEIQKNWMFSQLGHVFHGNDIGLGALGQSRKLIEQTPLVIASLIISLSICREGLTGGASSQDFDRGVAKQSLDLLGG